MSDATPSDLPERPDEDPVEDLSEIIGADLVPLSLGSIPVIRDGDDILVALRHATQALGVDYMWAWRLLKARSWARVGLSDTRDRRGRRQRMVTIDRRTYIMWLATINENRVPAGPVRERVIATQNEAAGALDAYVSKGYAINPRGLTPEQVEFMGNLFDDRALTWATNLAHGWDAHSRAKGRYDGPDGQPLSAAERRASADTAGRLLGKVYEQLIDAGLLGAVNSKSIEGPQ